MENDQEKSLICIILSIIGTIFSLIFIFLLVAQNFHTVDLSDQISKIFVMPLSSFAPEPLERTLFITGIFLTPLFLYGWYYFSRKIILSKIKNENALNKLCNKLIIGSFYFITSLFIIDFLTTRTYYQVLHKYISHFLFFVLSVSALILSYILVYKDNKMFKKISCHAVKITACLVTIILPLLVLFNEQNVINQDSIAHQFSCVFYAMVQVFLGKELLVDLNNLYGLYPHFLNPIFQIIGLSVFKFCLIMAILLVLSYFFIFKFLEESIKDKFVAYISYIAIVFAGYLFIKPFASYDVYFQYAPIRVIFPALSILLTWKYFNNKSKLLYFISWILYSIAILWNLDVGIVVFIAWLAVLIYQELIENTYLTAFKKILKHMIIGFSSLISVIILYSLLMKLIYGYFPNLGLFFNYQSIFYICGYAMIPMKIIHPWNLVILTYLVGLAISVKNFFNKQVSPIDKSIFYLSILGIGIFSYFQGRSHDYCIIGVNYPAFLLLGIFIDKILNKDESLNICCFPSTKFISTMLISFLIFLNLGLIVEVPLLVGFLKERYVNITAKKSDNVLANELFLKSNIQPKEKVLILSNSSDIYYLESKADAPVKVPGFLELFLQKDYEKVYSFLIKNKTAKVFFDCDNFVLPANPFKYKIIQILQQKYYVTNISQDGTKMILQKR